MSRKKDIELNEQELIKSIRKSLGLPSREEKAERKLNEAYVTQAKKFDLKTELLSNKNKRAHLELMERYIETLNQVSAQLDAVDRGDINANSSEFRSLKQDETYNLNAAFLHGMYFENISDLQSQLTMDTLTFMRIERDFGSFDDWQKDFIACAMSCRNGWALTVYNSHLNRFINVAVDLHSHNVPVSSFPVIVLDMWEHSYYRDYLRDKRTYIHAMMKELDWQVIEERVKKADKIAKVMGQ
jgi:Fe-Mn family superoxide dismutase